jgi:hypothetical protein
MKFTTILVGNGLGRAIDNGFFNLETGNRLGLSRGLPLPKASWLFKNATNFLLAADRSSRRAIH